MALNPQFAATPKIGAGALSAANTARDGSGTLVTVFTAGANGSRIDYISIQATATTTAGMIRLFLHDGTTARLAFEIPITAVTPSATIPTFGWGFVPNNGSGVILPTGWSLRATTEKAEAFQVLAFGGDF